MLYGRNGKIIQVDLVVNLNQIIFVYLSLVYNWTTDNVVDWLVNFVHLPQYVENFRRNQFDGRMIPR